MSISENFVLEIRTAKELNIKGKLLDPYCGSGSCLTAGLENGFLEMDGFDVRLG